MEVELNNIATTKTMQALVSRLNQYREALGHDPTAFWVTPSQMVTISGALEKHNKKTDFNLREASTVVHQRVAIRVAA